MKEGNDIDFLSKDQKRDILGENIPRSDNPGRQIETEAEKTKSSFEGIIGSDLGPNPDQLSIGISRLYYSNGCKIFYVIIILMNLALVIWSIVDYTHVIYNVGFHVLEGIINGILVIDVLMRMKMVGFKRYFKHWFNWVEIIVTILCIIAFIVSFVSSARDAEIEDILIALLIIFRCIVQYLRIMLFVKQGKDDYVVRKTQINIHNMPEIAEMENEDPNFVVVDYKNPDRTVTEQSSQMEA